MEEQSDKQKYLIWLAVLGGSTFLFQIQKGLDVALGITIGCGVVSGIAGVIASFFTEKSHIVFGIVWTLLFIAQIIVYFYDSK